MDVFKLTKPDVSKQFDKVAQLFNSGTDIFSYIEKTHTPEYLYWDKVQYKPRPKEVTAEEFWAIIKLVRQGFSTRAQTVVRDTSKNQFSWQPLPGLDHFLHEVDMQLGGALASYVVEGQDARQRYISRGIMEEAIASSQLEGANTTRRFAKKMLLEKRKPSNVSERMILNNYHAMLEVEQNLRNSPLSHDILLDLHTTLTIDTIPSSQVGRFRTDSDNIVVCDPTTNTIYHVPPPVKFLRSEMQRLLKYANDDLEKDRFVHPLIKAIILHFWIGYLHPFVDGNGRLARTVFYWYLLRKDYWAFSYLPISKVIRNSPSQYRDAYVYTEQDDNDLTYFIDYMVRKTAIAKREFERHVKRKEGENRKMARIAQGKFALNDRQIQLLRYLYKNTDATTLIETHSKVYGISRVTARRDLIELEQKGFLSSQKIGKIRPFRGTEKISRLFR